MTYVSVFLQDYNLVTIFGENVVKMKFSFSSIGSENCNWYNPFRIV